MISAVAAMILAGMEQATVPPSVPPPPVLRSAPAATAPPAPRKQARARPKADLASLIGDRDYPPSALRANEQGTVGFTLEVGPNGRVSGCRVTRPSGSAALDSATCRILHSRARFDPARDSLGRPAPDRFAGRIAWRINRRLNQPFAPLMMVEVMRSDAKGALSCFSEFNAEPSVRKPCPTGATGAELASLARALGKPLALSTVIRLTPDGAAEPADRAGRGDLYKASDAVLGIGADGAIAECRVVRSEWIGGGNKGVPPSPCLDWYPGMKLYRPVVEGTPLRSVKVTVRGYARH